MSLTGKCKFTGQTLVLNLIPEFADHCTSAGYEDHSIPHQATLDLYWWYQLQYPKQLKKNKV